MPGVRVAIITRALPIHRLGGLELHVRDLAVGLGRLGHEVHLITSAAPLPLDGAKADDEFAKEGVTPHFLRTGRPGDYSAAFFRGVGKKLREVEARHGRMDVVHAQEFAGLFLPAMPGRLVATVHGTLSSEVMLDRRYWRRLAGWRERGRALWRFKHRVALTPLFRPMLRRADLLLVDSEYTWREVRRLEPGVATRLKLASLGLDFERYPGREPERFNEEAPIRGEGMIKGPLRIALLGRVQRMKGLEVALEAAKVLAARGVAVEMSVGGSGDWSGGLARDAAAAGLAPPQFKLVGRVEPERLGAFLQRCDLFLFPDLTQPAFGLVAVEAMLYGLPVVATRSGAIPEVVTSDVGWLYEPWDVLGLAGLLERLARQRDEVAAKAAKARGRAEEFGSVAMARRVEAAYLELLGR